MAPSSTIPGRAGTVAQDLGAALLCVLVFWLPLDPPAQAETVLIAILVVGLLVRSWSPLPAFVLVAAATLAGAAAGMADDPFLAAAWTLYPVALRWGGRRFLPSIPVVLGVVIGLLMVTGPAGAEAVVRYAMMSLLALTAAWVLGAQVRRGRQAAEQATRAEKERAVAEERLRVVREVHDVVSHSLGTIAITSGVALHVGGDAEAMRGKLARIESASRRALDELRGVLRAVRDGGEGAERHPRLGVPDIPELVERSRQAGLPIAFTMTDVTGVPPAVGLAAYRIVQEALTNVARHAPGAHCRVSVSGAGGTVRVEIDDDGPRTAPTGGHPPGYGLIGLRERVELLGGSCTAGPRPGGGFTVRAAIPLEAADA
ncbi:sensor histidine kinase [Nonomuraea sp. B12E4]|uniref:sensor histidine kinase n=1 Tax=Nonomuraea sp. B12E4 TaxID=3153564 RepID=UPI00325F11F3